ncbi:PrsW family intramembrane metalloprotease [Lactiplantibacillus daowaiensis]|uniref:PrsW family glutamic-type intramembrane protease n=1 Tax=Lactiplantibacillus daowaiensis TaxID=2559918 RepID=A0ABW1S0U9_9LACO|nr:PrsW family intramembrane metalloprotease [Lactiplantibacillus daowaiensis]
MAEVIYCPHCGAQVAPTQRFCTHCGLDVRGPLASPTASAAKTVPVTHQNMFDSATTQLNGWTGQRRKVPIKLGSMFSEVFKRHTEADAETLFIVGTGHTTPTLQQVSDSPVKPWLFSRVFVIFTMTIAILAGSFFLFNGEKMYISLIFMSALAVPFSLLMLFFETNTFRNISIFKVTKIFMVGGVAAVLATMVLYQFVNVQNLTVVTAIIVAMVEETGKLIIIAYYVRRLNARFILNGLLIGAAVGAGFAAFETAGYAQDLGLSVLLIRSLGSLGTHTLWGAINGAALVLAKGDRSLTGLVFRDGRFLRFFGLTVALHAIWDMPVPFDLILQLGLIVVAWITVLVLINAGLREVRTLQAQT